MSPTVTPIDILSEDRTLKGQLFLPEGSARAAVVLNGATGVPQGYYRAFAAWLAEEQSIACLTYDYRDFGASRTGPLRQSDATMADWALKDQPAARVALRQALPGVPIWVIGHSLGAMLMPMQDDTSDVARMITVACGYVNHRDHPWPYQAVARSFWFGFGPVLTWALGYLPGRALGFGSDLPAGVYWQWRQWCTSLAFLREHAGKSLPHPQWNPQAPVRMIAMSDDDLVPPVAVWRLAEAYAGAEITRVQITPAEQGLRKIGHVGAFARSNAVLWPLLIAEGQGRG